MHKRILILLGVSLATFIAIYAFWVNFPAVKDPAFVEQAMKDAENRFQAVQAQANDPEKNGFLTPEFLPFWGRKGKEQNDKDPIHKVFDDWAKFSSQSTGEKVEHKKLQEAGDEKYLTALAEFEKVVPALLGAFKKPVFTAPEEKLAYDNIVMNFISQRKAAQTLVGYAEAKVAQGKPEVAADALVAVIENGSRLMGHSTLIHDMIGVAIQAIGGEGIALLVDPRQPLGVELLEELTGRLVAAVPAENHIYQSLEAELLMGHNGILDMAEKGGDAIGEDVPVGLLPGFLKREDRIYQNVMAELMQRSKTGESENPRWLQDPNWTDWVAGRTGIMAAILVPNFFRAGAQGDFNRARNVGLATAFGVMTFREKQGRLPKSLDEVAGSGIPVLPESDLKALTYQLEGETATLSVPFVGPKDLTFEVSPDEEGWFELKGEAIVFKI